LPFKSPGAIYAFLPLITHLILILPPFPPSAEASDYYFVNKSFNLSSSSTFHITLKYSSFRFKSSVEGVRDVTIHNVYIMLILSPTSMVNLSSYEPFSVDTHKIYSFVSAAIFDASTNLVLLGDFNINNPS
jgi:hypothetical protein